MPRFWVSEIRFAALLAAGMWMPSPAGAVMPTRDGTVPPEVAQSFAAGRFDLPAAVTLGTSLAGSTWKIPVILVDFTDQPLTYTSALEWDRALFDTAGATPTGSVFDYYTWVSGNRLRVVGNVVATIHLSTAKNDYAESSWGLSGGTYRAVDEALRNCPPVDWSEYDRDLDGYVDMVWVVHSGLGGEHVITKQDLWSQTSKLTLWGNGSVFVTTDRLPGTISFERINAFSILPEMSAFHIGQRSEIGVFCHEFGHALGLPDLYDTGGVGGGTRSVGPGNWSLMSTGVYGGDGLSPEYPTHIGAWPMLFLGWGSTVRPTEDGALALGPIENGGRILDLWFQGEASQEHFLVENRQRQGFDRNLPASGLVVYWVNDFSIYRWLPSNKVINSFDPALRLMEGDARQDLMLGWNRGDASDPMPGSTGLTRWDDDTYPSTRSVSGNVTNVALRDIAADGDSMRFQVQVRAPGWQPSRAISGSGYLPILGSGRGARAADLLDGGIALVTSENVAGRLQVVLRLRRPDHTWEPPFQVSATSGAATEPTLGTLPGGDLCVAWSDSRHGANELYYRARVLGVWTAERRLTDLPGYSESPALGADGRGGVHIAWHYSDGSGSRIYFMYFPYLTPLADPRPITAATQRPDPPALAIGRDGSSYILWTDRSVAPTSLWFAHFAPDSGVRPALSLVNTGSGIKPGVAAAVGPDGRLHSLWRTGEASGNEIHYQVRGRGTSADTVLVQRGESIQDFGIVASSDGGLHLILEAAASGSSQILYKEWRSNGGWDIGSTEMTRVGDATATRPVFLPLRPGAGTVLYVAYPAAGPALFERDRGLWQQPLAAVPEAAPDAHGEFRAGPNPLCAGKPLLVRLEGRAPLERRLDVYDLAGRRVATAELHAQNGVWSAEIPASTTESWPNGMYFARAAGGRIAARVVVVR